jgi:hypothetical protein
MGAKAMPSINILKQDSGDYISSPEGCFERIHYDIGRFEGALYFRITEADRGGSFPTKWIPFAIFEHALDTWREADSPESATYLKRFLSGLDNNDSAGFIVSVLRNEGLLAEDEHAPNNLPNTGNMSRAQDALTVYIRETLRLPESDAPPDDFDPVTSVAEIYPI